MDSINALEPLSLVAPGGPADIPGFFPGYIFHVLYFQATASAADLSRTKSNDCEGIACMHEGQREKGASWAGAGILRCRSADAYKCLVAGPIRRLSYEMPSAGVARVAQKGGPLLHNRCRKLKQTHARSTDSYAKLAT